MKKLILVLLFFVLTSLTVKSQSCMYDNNQVCTNTGDGWGRWIRTSEDIKVENCQKGNYSFMGYIYGESQPYLKLKLKYKLKEESWYVYSVTYATFNGGKSENQPYYVVFKSSEKLSDMANGENATVNIFVGTKAIGFSLGKM